MPMKTVILNAKTPVKTVILQARVEKELADKLRGECARLRVTTSEAVRAAIRLLLPYLKNVPTPTQLPWKNTEEPQ